MVSYEFDEATPDVAPADPNVGAYGGTLTTSLEFYQGADGTGTFRGSLSSQPNQFSGIQTAFDGGPTSVDAALFFTPFNVGLSSFITTAGVFDPFPPAAYQVLLVAGPYDTFVDDGLANVTQATIDTPPVGGATGILLTFFVEPSQTNDPYTITYGYVPESLAPIPLPATGFLLLAGLGLMSLARRRS